MTRKMSVAKKRERDGLKPGQELFCIQTPLGFKSLHTHAALLAEGPPPPMTEADRQWVSGGPVGSEEI